MGIESKKGLALTVTGEICDIAAAASISLNSKRDRSGTFHGVRKLAHGQTGKRITYFCSAINGGHIPCESDLESKYGLTLERTKGVIGYRSQPLTIFLGDKEKYTPDFAIKRSDGQIILVEVKPSAKHDCPEIKIKLDKANLLIADAGLQFVRVSEKSLLDHISLKTLLGFYNPTFSKIPPPNLIAYIRDLFSERNIIALSSLRHALVQGGWNERWAHYFLFHGHLVTDLMVGINKNSLVQMEAYK